MMCKKYDKYQESNIEWIGLIPSSWKLTRLKFLADIITGSTPSKNDDTYYKDGSFPWVKPDDLKGLTPITTTNVLINDEGKRVSRIIPKDSILVCCIGSLGKIGIAGTKLATNQQINSLIPNKLLNNNYCKYMIIASSSEYNKYANSNVVAIINKQQQGELTYPLPSLEEQKQIANYLDKKTAKIDETIAKNEELIQLLEEKRVALINQVVTKGLNPDVSMKDSGVEWIGEIPEHWDVINLKKCCEKITDGSHFSPETTAEGKYYITVRNILDDKIDFENAPKISLDDYKVLKNNGCEPKKGDVLLSKDGTIGKCIIVNETNFVILSSLGLLRPNYLINSKYLRYYLLSDINMKQMLSNIRGSAIKRLTINIIKELLLILPPCEEQEAITTYLDPNVNKINRTIDKIQNNIALLEEYKTSLIHHVVTGKIDVRGEDI